jgi:hypothetical protein
VRSNRSLGAIREAFALRTHGTAEVGRRHALQLPQFAPLWREHAYPTFVEPFCGALALTFGLQPDRALLNHANPHVIYRTPAREVLAVRNL